MMMTTEEIRDATPNESFALLVLMRDEITAGESARGIIAFARAVERAAYERAAAHVRTLKRDWWRLRAAPEIVVEECAVAIEKLMTQEQDDDRPRTA